MIWWFAAAALMLLQVIGLLLAEAHDLRVKEWQRREEDGR